MKKNIVIIGSVGHARVVIDAVEKQGIYKIIGLIDDFRSPGERTFGYDVMGKVEDFAVLIEKFKIDGCFIAIGDNWSRKIVHDKITSNNINIEFITVIHPSAQIGRNVTINKGAVLMAGAIINSNSNVGNFSIINTKASIDHDCFIGNFASLAPNVTLGGYVKVGDYTAISMSATLKNSIEIGEHCVIGAGALVLNNVENNKIVYGIPAKVIRERHAGEQYL